jgi:hypothetical protein
MFVATGPRCLADRGATGDGLGYEPVSVLAGF